MRKTYPKLYFLCASLLLTSTALADTTTISRYMTVNNKPRLDQMHLLQQTMQVHFPEKVTNIGEAMNYLLRYSGYSLVAINQQSSELKSTLAKPLPAIDRDFGPMTLQDALSTLAGPSFALTQDALNRTVNFKLAK